MGEINRSLNDIAGIIKAGRDNHESCTITAKKVARHQAGKLEALKERVYFVDGKANLSPDAAAINTIVDKIIAIIRQHEADMGGDGLCAISPGSEATPLTKSNEIPDNEELRQLVEKSLRNAMAGKAYHDFQLESALAVDALLPYFRATKPVSNNMEGVQGCCSHSSASSADSVHDVTPSTHQPVDLTLIRNALEQASDALGALRRGHGLDVGELCYPARNTVEDALDHLRGLSAPTRESQPPGECREAFEKWLGNESGYASPDEIDYAWSAWQAAWKPVRESVNQRLLDAVKQAWQVLETRRFIDPICAVHADLIRLMINEIEGEKP